MPAAASQPISDPEPGVPRPRDLPAPPRVALRVLQVCADPKADGRTIADIVEQDPTLTVSVLRVVNSAFFGFIGRVTSVRHAVAILGQRGLRNYVLCLAVRDALRPAILHGLDTGLFWEASLHRAVAGRVLAPAAGVDPDIAFTACLLQDIGFLALVYGHPEASGLVGGLLQRLPDERLEREREVFGETHAVAGLHLAEAWELPEPLAHAIGYHHGAGPPSHSGQALVRVATCADWMAAVYTSEDTRRGIARARELGLELFGLDEARVDALLAEMAEQVSEAAEALGLDIEQTESFDQLLNHANLALAEENLGYQELAWRLQRTVDEHESLTRRLRDELEKAKLVQRALLPRAARSGRFRGINVPARELSGDFFDFFPAAGGRWCFALGDVSGKGMDAALLMSKTSSLFHCLGKVVSSPARLLEALNAELCELSIRGMFVTMVAGVLEPESGRVQIANAGHPPGLLVDRHGRCEQIHAGAPPLGVMSDFEFPAEEHDLGQRTLYLYSDGVMEAAAERWRSCASSPDAVVEAIRNQRSASPEVFPARLVNSLVRPGQPLGDDLTVLQIAGARQD